MIRSAASKIAWVGRTASMVFGLALVLALVFGVASAALGADGDLFKVGRINVAESVSKLIKSGAGPALELQVDSGPALKVNSGAKVAKLNADKLDGLDSTGFYAAGSKVADSSHADQADSATTAQSATNAQNAANANTLDGKDSTGFYAAGSKVADADKLDGKDSTALGVTMKSNQQYTAVCTLRPGWASCAPITVTVPAGKQYQVTVWSSFAAMAGSTNEVTYCPAIKGGSSFPNLTCIVPRSFIALAGNYAESAASSGEITVPVGTYTFSTALLPADTLAGTEEYTQTTVMVQDVSAPGPPIN